MDILFCSPLYLYPHIAGVRSRTWIDAEKRMLLECSRSRLLDTELGNSLRINLLSYIRQKLRACEDLAPFLAFPDFAHLALNIPYDCFLHHLLR